MRYSLTVFSIEHKSETHQKHTKGGSIGQSKAMTNKEIFAIQVMIKSLYGFLKFFLSFCIFSWVDIPSKSGQSYFDCMWVDASLSNSTELIDLCYFKLIVSDEVSAATFSDNILRNCDTL